MTEAYRSTLDISFEVKAGLLIRQTHHWAADVFLVAIVLHLLRVFFTGAYRKPRELTYLIGVTMLALALLEGYLGYSLVDDLLSGMGLAIGYSVLISVPLVGANLASLVWGGPFPGGPDFWPRMYIAHVLLLPVAIGTLLGLHLLLVASRHHTQFRGRAADGAPRRRHPDLPRPGAALARALLRRRRAARAARRPRSDQPDLALGPLPRRVGDERRAAGLVPRLADRQPSARARLGSRDRRPDGRAEPVLGRRALPGRRVRLPLPLAVDRAPGHPATSEWANLLDRPRDRPVANRLGVALVTWLFVVFLAGSADRVTVPFGISYTAQIWAYRVLFFVAPVVALLVTRRVCASSSRTRRRGVPSPDGGAVPV